MEQSIEKSNILMVEEFMHKLKKFSTCDTQIQSVILVGSYANNTYTETSDLDFCIITTNKNDMLQTLDFIKVFGECERKQNEYYGACTSVRVWYRNGLEVEFGICEPSWIHQPLDRGTRQVLSNGYKVIVDKKKHFHNLQLNK